MKTFCGVCGKIAVWHYMPSDHPEYVDLCDDCVSRGCSCNVDPNTGIEDTDDKGRLFPCNSEEKVGIIVGDYKNNVYLVAFLPLQPINFCGISGRSTDTIYISDIKNFVGAYGANFVFNDFLEIWDE